MDVMRSCHESNFCFDAAGTLVPVKWYRAAADAPLFPSAHCFGSRDLDDGDQPDLGEQQPPRGKWLDGQRPARLTGFLPIQGKIDDFSQPSFPLPYVPDVTVAIEPCTSACPECEFGELPVAGGQPFWWDQACGGYRWTGQACGTSQVDNQFETKFSNNTDWPLCIGIPFETLLDFDSGVSCGVLDGVEIELFYSLATGKWHGEVIGSFGETIMADVSGFQSSGKVRIDLTIIPGGPGGPQGSGFLDFNLPLDPNLGPYHRSSINWDIISGYGCTPDSQAYWRED